MHFCGGELKSIGLFEAEACQMEQIELSAEEFAKLPPCHQKKYLAEQPCNQKDGFHNGSCCHDEQLNFNTEDAAEKYAKTPSIWDEVPVVVLYLAIDLRLFTSEQRNFCLTPYVPPSLYHDINVVQQVFRI
jgi:hypothetical protein